MDAQELELAKSREENRHLSRIHLVESITRIALTALQWGGLIAIAYFIYQTVGSLAGKTTLADIGLKGDLRISDGIAVLFGGGGMAYGLRQRKLRRDTIEHLTSHNANLEKQIDPKRSSSQLTRRGTTRPEDR